MTRMRAQLKAKDASRSVNSSSIQSTSRSLVSRLCAYLPASDAKNVETVARVHHVNDLAQENWHLVV